LIQNRPRHPLAINRVFQRRKPLPQLLLNPMEKEITDTTENKETKKTKKLKTIPVTRVKKSQTLPDSLKKRNLLTMVPL